MLMRIRMCCLLKVILSLSDKQSWPSRHSQQMRKEKPEGENSGLRFPEILDFGELRSLMLNVADEIGW